jgi:TP901-1 family phage major tail protein
MAQSGTLVLILVEDPASAGSYRAIGGQRGADISRTADLIDASTKDDPNTDFLPGRLNSTISMDAVYLPNDNAIADLKSAYESKTQVTIRKQDAGTAIEEAIAYVVDISESHPDNDVATYSIELQVVGGGWSAV